MFNQTQSDTIFLQASDWTAQTGKCLHANRSAPGVVMSTSTDCCVLSCRILSQKTPPSLQRRRPRLPWTPTFVTQFQIRPKAKPKSKKKKTPSLACMIWNSLLSRQEEAVLKVEVPTEGRSPSGASGPSLFLFQFLFIPLLFGSPRLLSLSLPPSLSLSMHRQSRGTQGGMRRNTRREPAETR